MKQEICRFGVINSQPGNMKKTLLPVSTIITVVIWSQLLITDCFSQTPLTKVLELKIDTKGGANGASDALQRGDRTNDKKTAIARRHICSGLSQLQLL